MRSDKPVLWNLRECLYDMTVTIASVASRLRSGDGVLWQRGRPALAAAYALKDYRFLRRHLRLIVDIHLGCSPRLTYGRWNSEEADLIQAKRNRENKRCYEESLRLAINNCLQAVQDKNGPFVFTSLLSKMLDWSFRRNGRPGMYVHEGQDSQLYRMVVEHYLRVRPNYVIRAKYAKRIVIRGPPPNGA